MICFSRPTESMRSKLLTHSRQWRIQGFPEEGALAQKGAPTYYLANFSRKLHENEEILGQKGGVPRAPLDPPLVYLNCSLLRV